MLKGGIPIWYFKTQKKGGGKMRTCRLGKTRFVLAILVAFMLVLGLGKMAGAKEKVIVIGHIYPMTGAQTDYWVTEIKAAELAVNEVNEKGGIKGYKIKVIAEDGEAVPLQSSQAAKKLVTRDKVDIVIGGESSPAAIAMAEITSKYGVPHIVPTALAAHITDAGKYKNLFRTAPHNGMVGTFLGRLLAEHFKFTRVATIFFQDDFGIDLNNVVVGELKKKGVNVVAQEGVERTLVDFYAIVSKYKPLKPQAIVAPIYNKPAAQLALTMREQGMTGVRIADTVMLTPTFIQLAGEAGWGSVHVPLFHSTRPTPEAQAFVRKFKAKYGALAGNFAGETYDAFGVTFDALKRGGIGAKGFDRKGFIRAMRQTDNFLGVMGPLKFDKNGQCYGRNKYSPVENVRGELKAIKVSF
jgi:branched-chain amino acid transport system substrate-binding protein